MRTMNVVTKLQKYSKITQIIRRYASTKLSYRHNVPEYPLLGLTGGQQLEQTVSKFRDNLAIISPFERKSLSYGDLLETVDKLGASLLTKLGLRKGDFVGIWSPNCINWMVASLACARTGLVLVQLNPSYKGNELLYCINKVGVKAVICGRNYEKQNYYEIFKSIDENIFDNGPNVRSKVMPSLKTIISMEDNLKGTIYFDSLIHEAEDLKVELVKRNQNDIDIDDYLNVQFTSGSTGNPKAALLTHHNVVNNSYVLGHRVEMHLNPTKICVQVPFFHTFGTTGAIFACVNFGVTLVLPYDFYNPEKSLFCVKEHKCNIIYGTPTMYVDLIYQQKKHKLDIKPDVGFIGGALSPKQLLNDIYDVLNCKNVMNIYGLTETTAVVFQTRMNTPREIATTKTGFLQDHIEVKVVDGKNKVVPFGTAGELCVRGYCNIVEYFEDPEKTQATIGKDKWLRTGDKFVMYEDGTGSVVGRLKDIIIRGGENIHPKEIEDFICSNPKVVDCQIVGLPHERLGEEICACVRLEDGESLKFEELREFCKDKIAHYKVPSKLDIFTEFPKTTSGKIQKFKIIEELKRKYKISDLH